MDKSKQNFFANKWNLITSLLCIFIITIVGCLLLYAENVEQNTIYIPEKEYFEKPISIEDNHDCKININTAPKEELMLIDGIGEKKAEAILEYRQNTPFTKTEDIMEISGFGAKIFEKIADKICVE